MRRTTIGALLSVALLAGPAAVTAEAQAQPVARTATVQAAQSQTQNPTQVDRNKDDGGGGWGLWGLAGLLGLLGLVPRGRKGGHDTGTYRGTGGTGTGTRTDRP
ncbi:WGxxGxxG family protein [Streptomyces sp. NPDC052051]|uniref:WGxxGxxG family protein n=1 Tax=Streptomyces sp. NPDC052051 TaxID=3154649 RepID=UPI00341A91ED